MDKQHSVIFGEEDPEVVRWNFDDAVVFTFNHERHMYEFMDYRNYDTFGKSKLFRGKFEMRVLKKNFKFAS